MRTPETNVEREVKLDAGLRFELPELTGIIPGVVATRLANAKLQAIYVDTADLRLMRWGVTLRHRRDVVGGAGAESGWTVKLPVDAGGVALVRTELSWPGPFGPVPAEVASLVRAQARTARLLPVAKLLTERHRVELRDRAGAKLGEVDDDVVSVMDGRRLAARFRQVELELTDEAPPELLDEVMRELTLAGAVAGDDRPKVVRAIGPRASLGPDVVIPVLDGKSTVATVVGAAIAAGVTRIIRHDPGVRLGDDPEHVHQARVGTRRLRSDLRTFWRLLDPDWAAAVRAELGWLAAVMGEVRDADVLTGRLRRQIRSLSGLDAKAAAALLRRLAIQRAEARAGLLEALDSERYLALLENLAQAAAYPPLARHQSDPRASPDSAQAAHPAHPDQGTQGAAPEAEPTAAGPGINGSAGTRGNGTAPPEMAPVAGMAGAVGATAPPAPLPTTGWAAATAPTAPGMAPGPVDSRHRPGGGSDLDLASRRAAEVLPALVRRPWKHLQQAVEHLGEDPPDEALHEIRIRAKRMRYGAEAVAEVVGKPARQLASAVAAVQGVLGDMQDAVVAETWLRHQASSGSPSQALVAGQLITLQRQQQAECRDRWAEPWKEASKKSLRSWLKS